MTEPKIDDEQTTLWATCSGEYSDYSVIAVFDTEADARAATKLGGLGDDVLELDHFRAGDVPVKRDVWTAYSGRIDPDGGMSPSSAARATVRQSRVPPRRRLDRPHVHVEREGVGVWVTVEASTKELAEKTLYDRIAKVRAELLEPAASEEENPSA